MAISMIPPRVFFPAPIWPICSIRFFRPRRLGCSGKGSWTSRKFSSDAFHCSRSALEWTRIRVLTLRCPIKYAPTTVLPKAVVADRTPMSWDKRALAAGICSWRSSPRKATLICCPGWRWSAKMYGVSYVSSRSFNGSKRPLGIPIKSGSS